MSDFQAWGEKVEETKSLVGENAQPPEGAAGLETGPQEELSSREQIHGVLGKVGCFRMLTLSVGQGSPG